MPASKTSEVTSSERTVQTRATRADIDESRSIMWIPTIFIFVSCILYYLSINFPHNSSKTSSVLKFPGSIEELNVLQSYLMQYKNDHFKYVCLLFCCAYVYKQTFAIPGSVFLNILAGALFGTLYGFPLICILTACGATLCFLLSQNFGKGTLVYYFPEKVQLFQDKVMENADSLFFYLLFLRLFPFSPNWFMNMAAPIVGVPVHLFILSVIIGLMPYNFICVQMGVLLSEFSSLIDVFTPYTMLQLAFLAVVALVPGLIIKKIQLKRQETKQKSE